MIWLRRYPTMHHLSMQFGIEVSRVHSIIHRMILLMHCYLVPKYIRWHSMIKWKKYCWDLSQMAKRSRYTSLMDQSLDIFEMSINLINHCSLLIAAVMDCTPMRISKPKGDFLQIISPVIHSKSVAYKHTWDGVGANILYIGHRVHWLCF